MGINLSSTAGFFMGIFNGIHHTLTFPFTMTAKILGEKIIDGLGYLWMSTWKGDLDYMNYMQGLQFILEFQAPERSGYDVLWNRGELSVAAQMAKMEKVQQRFEQGTTLNLSDYARDTGVGVFSWGDVGLEKREAFEDAYVTVQGLWLGTHFTPNGTFSGSTPEGFEFSGRWRTAPDGIEETNEAYQEALNSLPEYYSGNGEYRRR